MVRSRRRPGRLTAVFTIIGIPPGIQAFKIASFTLLPFGKDVSIGQFGVGRAVDNVIWIILIRLGTGD